MPEDKNWKKIMEAAKKTGTAKTLKKLYDWSLPGIISNVAKKRKERKTVRNKKGEVIMRK